MTNDSPPKPQPGLVTPDKPWEEYKYRHEHVWKLVFQITTAVVAVSIVPYILSDRIEKKLGYFIIALPFIGLALTTISTLRIYKECSLLSILRNRHRELNKFNIPGSSTFTLHIVIYFVTLIILSMLNIGVVAVNTFSCK